MKKALLILLISFSYFCVAQEQLVSKWAGQITPITKGKGTAENPYLIENADQFAFLSTQKTQNDHFLSAHYKLMIDIDLVNLPWTPVGKPEFSGIFDENGHTVKNNNKYIIGKVNTNDWEANLASDFVSWMKNWKDVSQGIKGRKQYEFKNGHLRLWTEKGSKQRSKVQTIQGDFTYGTYNWRVYIPQMGKNEKVSIGAFLYYDDKHELDFEIGSGTKKKRAEYKAKENEVLMYLTSQAFPWHQTIHCIETEKWYDLGLKLEKTPNDKYFVTWLFNGKVIDSVKLKYGKEIPFKVHCSLENLEFMGDIYSTREHYTCFNKVGVTPITKKQ